MRYMRYKSKTPNRPQRQWVSLSGVWTISSAVDTQAALMSLEMPTALALTADLPEGLVVMRIVGDYECLLDTAAGNWTLGLLVADSTWSIGTAFSADADKRILWSRSYGRAVPVANTLTFKDGYVRESVTATGATVAMAGCERQTHIDISPKVTIRAGQTLWLAAWEDAGGAGFTTVTTNIRMLIQRKARR